MEQKINLIIQARMGSTRLAGKILKPIMGRPMLSYLIERLRYVKMPHSLILASTTNPIDDELEAFAKNENLLFFRGSEDDVLDRYYQTCCLYPADLIVRITSDCPLLDPSIVNQAIKNFQNLDYLSNVHPRTFPRGMDLEVFTFEALKIAAHEAKTLSEREHVTPFIYLHPERFKLGNFIHHPDASSYRLTVDTTEDFLLISKIFETLYPKNKKFRLSDILFLLEKNPEWKSINAHVKQKEI